MTVRHVRLIPPPPMPGDSPHDQRISGVVRKAARVPADLVEEIAEYAEHAEHADDEPSEPSKDEVPTLPPPRPVIPREEAPTSPGRPNKIIQKASPRRRKRLEGARADAVTADLRNDPRREK
jgi:hypothetical protein